MILLTFRNCPLPWQMVFHALISRPEGARREQIKEFIEETFPGQLGTREVARMVEITLEDMVGRFNNVIENRGIYKLRDRSPSEQPKPIPSGCNREERRVERRAREGSYGGGGESWDDTRRWREGRETRERIEKWRQEVRGSQQERRGNWQGEWRGSYEGRLQQDSYDVRDRRSSCNQRREFDGDSSLSHSRQERERSRSSTRRPREDRGNQSTPLFPPNPPP